MTALTTATSPQPIPTTSNTNNNNNKFNLPPEWINKEMQVARNVEHLQAAIVDVSRNLMQIITWSEMIQEDIDGMQNSISKVSNLETLEQQEPESEPDPDDIEQEEPEGEGGERINR